MTVVLFYFENRVQESFEFSKGKFLKNLLVGFVKNMSKCSRNSDIVKNVQKDQNLLKV